MADGATNGNWNGGSVPLRALSFAGALAAVVIGTLRIAETQIAAVESGSIHRKEGMDKRIDYLEQRIAGQDVSLQREMRMLVEVEIKQREALERRIAAIEASK